VEVRLTRAAAKAISRSDKRKLIRKKIAQLADDPESLKANVSRLQGREDFRLRVQNWRVIFRIERDTVLVKAVLPRGSAYEENP
jgi:mRNA interferase RelE/StbE